MPRRSKKTITWPDAIHAYVVHLRAKRAAALTIDAYQRAVELLRDQVSPLRPHQVRTADLREVQAGLLTGAASRSGTPLSPGAASRHCAAWRSYFAFLHTDNVIKANPAALLDLPKVPKRTPGLVLTVKETERLLNAAAPTSTIGLRDRAVLEVMYSTALRRAEVCGLDLSDVDHQEREVIVRHGKGGDGRVVPLTRSAYGWLERYIQSARPTLASSHPDSTSALFLTRFGTRIDAQTLHRLLQSVARRAKLKKKISPHTIRRSAATQLMDAGANLRHIQLLLGHASLATTAAYLRVDARNLRRDLLLKHPRERFA